MARRIISKSAGKLPLEATTQAGFSPWVFARATSTAPRLSLSLATSLTLSRRPGNRGCSVGAADLAADSRLVREEMTTAALAAATAATQATMRRDLFFIGESRFATGGNG